MGEKNKKMKKMNMTKLGLAICSVLLAIGMIGTLAMADELNEPNIYISPYMINLNANHNDVNDISKADHEIVVTIGQRFSSGLITNLEVDLLINGDFVAEAVSAHVTSFTGLINMDFENAEIQEYAIDNGLEGVVDVTVTGSFTHNTSSGDESNYAFIGCSQVYFK